MNARQQNIMERLEAQEFCSYVELATDLGVSGMTVRRDVDQLAEGGLVIKALRGCRRAADTSANILRETTLQSRVREQVAEKRAIAGAAVDLIGDRKVVYLDGGTTCLELAAQIAERCRGLTVVTNSALAGMKAGANGANTVIVFGGQYDHASASFVGPVAEEMAERYFFDLAFLSTKGFVVSEGTFESSMPTFRIKRIVADRCKELLLLIDHTKFGRKALSKVVDVSKVHGVVTDAAAPAKDLAALRRKGKRVWVASVRPKALHTTVQ